MLAPRAAPLHDRRIVLARIASALLVSFVLLCEGRADDAKVLALTDLVMGETNDARKAIAIGPTGQVYEPTNGAWVRTAPIGIADKVSVVGRASGVVVLADGAVYRLADNGWSAIRLHQKQKALMSAGGRSVAIVGRQLFALNESVNGEPKKLGAAPSGVTAIGAGPTSIVVATDRGLQRLGAGAGWKPIAKAPKRVDRLLDDRYALIDRGVADLVTGAVTPWPAEFRVGAVATVDGSASIAKELVGNAKPTPKAKGKAAAKKPRPTGTLVVAAGVLRGTPTMVVLGGGAVLATEEIGVTTPDGAVVLSNVLAADISPGGGRFEDFARLLVMSPNDLRNRPGRRTH